MLCCQCMINSELARLPFSVAESNKKTLINGYIESAIYDAHVLCLLKALI